MKFVLAAFVLFTTFSSFGQNEAIDFTSPTTPKVFAPGFISDGFDNRDMTISPKGDELFFSISTNCSALS